MNILLYCGALVTGDGAMSSYLYAPKPVAGTATVIIPVEPAVQDGTDVDPAGKASATGAEMVVVLVTLTPQPSVILTV